MPNFCAIFKITLLNGERYRDLVKTYLKECEEKGYQEIPRISWESWSQGFRLLNPDGSVFEPEELESVAD